MKKKIIISILGLCLLMGIHYSINVFLLNREMESTLVMLPLFALVYYGYLNIIIRKYLKL